ncbi:ABC transporter substrate-binding protein [Anaerocolumna jejuensis]|uniref:ABC transporter substrate-binding protein n=1 Tax=Anaerocolumna jejuensis TaxID=259063 RepID=UPI003F7C677C
MKRKKWMALFLAAVIMIAGLTGCGSSKDPKETAHGSTDTGEEPYEATLMYWAGNDARDLKSVEAAFNELTMTQLNMKVNLMPVTLGTYAQQIQMVMSSDDKMDILPIYGSDVGPYVEAGYLVDINPYLETAGKDLIDIIGKEDISCCSIGDFLWGVPNMHERTNPVTYVVRTDLLEEAGFKAEDIHTMGDLTAVFAKVKEKHPNMVMYNGLKTLTQPAIQTTFDALGGGKFGVLMNNGQDTTVTNWYESDEFRSLIDTMYVWNQKGYLSQDLATSTDSGESLMRAGNAFSFTAYGKPNSKAEKDSATGYDTTIIPVTDSVCYTSTTNALGYAVSANSENPEKAVTLLNWIYKTKEANDLLNWGVEGKDYVVQEDGTLNYPEGVTAENVGYHQDFGWAMMNQYNSYVWDGTDPDIWNKYKEARDNAIVSKAYGFTFDTAPVINEIAALTSVSDQYLVALGAGVVDPKSGIKEFNKALYAAGLQNVIDEKQKQFDEWYKAK